MPDHQSVAGPGPSLHRSPAHAQRLRDQPGDVPRRDGRAILLAISRTLPVQQFPGLGVEKGESRSCGGDQFRGAEAPYVVGEGSVPPLGVAVAGVADLTASGRPSLVVLVAVALQASAQALKETGQGVAVPFLQAVAIGGDAGTSALVGKDSELVNHVRVVGPAGRDHALGIPHVLVVEPQHDLV